MVDVDDVTWSSPAELKKWNLRGFSQKCMVVLGDAATRHIPCTECRAATIEYDISAFTLATLPQPAKHGSETVQKRGQSVYVGALNVIEQYLG